MKVKRSRAKPILRSRRSEALQLLVDQPQVARITEWLLTGVPPILKQWIVGPTNTITLDGRGHATPCAFSRSRPTRIIVPPELVLRKRVEIPDRGRRDARHIVDLVIRSETPFARGEVFARLVRLPAGGSDRPRYDLLLVPREHVEQALKDHGIWFGRPVEVFVSDGGKSVRIGPAHRPIQRVAAAAAWAVPLLVVVGAIGQLGGNELAVRQVAMSELEAITTQETVKLRELMAERDALAAEASKFDVARVALENATPTGWLLASLRNALPPEVDVARIDFRDQTVRVQIRGPDSLGTAQTIGRALPGWIAAVDGTITNDPRGGEVATIRLAREDQSS